jgi:hypothetical protein
VQAAHGLGQMLAPVAEIAAQPEVRRVHRSLLVSTAT